MKTLLKDVGVVQNMGWHDRTIRVVLGTFMLAYPMHLMMTGTPNELWMSSSILVSVYPIITGIIGFDFFYSVFNVKSCDSSNRNQCGSYPYEIDAALGRNPISGSKLEHDLQNSHHAT